MKKLLSVLAVLVLSACGTTEKLDTALLEKPIPSGHARIIVDREPALIGIAAAVRVEVNGAEIGRLGNGGSAMRDMRAGSMTLKVSNPPAPGTFAIAFDATAGKTYRFVVSPRSEAVAFGALWGPIGDAINASVRENTGYFQIAPVE